MEGCKAIQGRRKRGWKDLKDKLPSASYANYHGYSNTRIDR